MSIAVDCHDCGKIIIASKEGFFDYDDHGEELYLCNICREKRQAALNADPVRATPCSYPGRYTFGPQPQ